jgi:hypothetical protein
VISAEVSRKPPGRMRESFDYVNAIVAISLQGLLDQSRVRVDYLGE